MKLRTLLIINTIVAGVFGLAFVIIPWQVFSLYGPETSDILNYMGQLLGAAFIGFALLSWKARNAAQSDALAAIIFSFFVADSIGFVVALIGQLNNVVNAFGWSTVAIYFLLAAGFGYFQFSKSSSEET